MNKFKPGTKVRCVDDSPVNGLKTGKVFITNGKEYITISMLGHPNLNTDDWVFIIHDLDAEGLYPAARFELVDL